MTDSLTVAREYLRKGWTPIAVPRGQKRPVEPGWQNLRIVEADLPAHFSGPTNIGLLTGEASGGLMDVDLDCDEAVALADAFLPPTEMQSGRASRPRSHRWYVVDQVPENLTLKNVDEARTVLLELRGSGRQTLVPPSVHPEGEAYLWDATLAPATVSGKELHTAVRRLGGASILACHWPRASGSRHEIANALAGMLLRAGWTTEEVATFIRNVATAAGDEELGDRTRAAVAAAKALARGGNVTGAPTLASLMDPRVVSRAREWLGLGGLSAFTASNAYAEQPIACPGPMVEAAFHGLLSAVRTRGNLAFSAEGAIGGGGDLTTVGGAGSAL